MPIFGLPKPDRYKVPFLPPGIWFKSHDHGNITHWEERTLGTAPVPDAGQQTNENMPVEMVPGYSKVSATHDGV